LLHPRITMKQLAFVFSVLVLPGCYSYTPTDLTAVPPGADVRLLVTRQGAFELSEVTEVDARVPIVHGRIVGREGDDLMLNVAVSQRQDGFHTVRLGQTIRIPLGEILSTEEKSLSPSKTGLALAGAVGGAAFVIFSIMKADGQLRDPTTDAPEFGLPWLTIPFGE
jgi:hypothetical protein